MGQISTFMAAADEDAFVAAFANVPLERNDATQWFFTFGAFQIQLYRSRRTDDAIVVGRIGVRALGDSPDAKAAKACYRRMRRYIQKRYSNELTWEDVDDPTTRRSIRTTWIGPAAMAEARAGKLLRTLGTDRDLYRLDG